MINPSTILLQFFTKALHSANGYTKIKNSILVQQNILIADVAASEPLKIDLDTIKHIYIVGCGKASAAMAKATEEILAERITDGVVSVKYGHCPSKPLTKIRLIEAGHPHPDAQGMEAASMAMTLLKKAGSNDLVIALISGGGSALWPLPVKGISLEDKIHTTKLLLESGATIGEINIIRKKLSQIKGGKAAIAAYPAQSIVYMISDVENNDPAVIASGPFILKQDDKKEIATLLTKYKLSAHLPENVRQTLAGNNDTPEPDYAATQSKIYPVLCGNNAIARKVIIEDARKIGFTVTDLGTTVFGEASIAAKEYVQKICTLFLEKPDQTQCFVSGGETTVTLGKNYGKGGRNQEFGLAAAIEIEKTCKQHNCSITLLSCGTDGTDGPTDATGVIVDETTIEKAYIKGFDPQKSLLQHDAYPLFEAINSLVKTGPTNTNVMDIQIAVVKPIVI